MLPSDIQAKEFSSLLHIPIAELFENAIFHSAKFNKEAASLTVVDPVESEGD